MEEVQLTEGLARSIDQARSGTEEVQLTEGLARSIDQARSATEEVQLTEGLARSIDQARSATEEVQLTEGLARSIDQARSATEEVQLTEGLARSIDQAQSATTEEVQLSEGQSLNILLLGPSGVGKSTFINALANYLAFNTVEEALEHDLVSLIHSEFTMTETKKGRRVETKISVGVPDADETAQVVGGSCTQRCKAYRFRIDTTQSICLIDTPGIGDTRGPDHDRDNMKATLSFLSKYKVLHAVCILLKPNETRLTDSLRYCIVQLLEKLHKDASKNILFCFTNTRSTFYRVESTYGLIETMLKPKFRDDNVLLDIQLEDENTMYCFDSEAFKFCAAVKKNMHFDDNDRESFKRSWETSTKEAFRLISHIASLEPHVIESTLSLNRVRSLLETLQGPLGKITAAMQTNMDASKKAQLEIEQSQDTLRDNSKLLYVDQTTTETVGLPQPRTACTEQECRAANIVCHDNCVPFETILGQLDMWGSKIPDIIQVVKNAQQMFSRKPSNFDQLPIVSDLASTEDSRGILRILLGKTQDFVFCQKLSNWSGKCTVCGHRNEKHIRERSEFKTVIRRIKDPAIQKILDETEDKAEQKRKMLKVYQDKEATIEKEIGVVLKAAALFAGFLEQNSIVTYHSATATYFRNQISQKKMSGAQNTAEGADQIEQLEKFLKTYQEKVHNFKTYKRDRDLNELITEDKINMEIQGLYALKEYGPTLKEWMNGVESEFAFKTAVTMAREEVTCNIPVYPVKPQQCQAGASGAPEGATHSGNLLTKLARRFQIPRPSLYPARLFDTILY